MFMIKVKVYNQQGALAGEKVLSEKVFGVKPKQEVVKQVVVAESANRRQNLAHTKTRSEVRGGGRKPWRQKGTGRARQGSIRSPQWRGGGVVFGPRKDRQYELRINKKMKRLALLMALSDKVNHNHFVVLDKLELSGKTKDWQTMSGNLLSVVSPSSGSHSSIVLIIPSVPVSIKRSVKNINKVAAIRADSLNVSCILKHEYALTTLAGVDFMESWLTKSKSKKI